MNSPKVIQCFIFTLGHDWYKSELISNYLIYKGSIYSWSIRFTISNASANVSTLMFILDSSYFSIELNAIASFEATLSINSKVFKYSSRET